MGEEQRGAERCRGEQRGDGAAAQAMVLTPAVSMWTGMPAGPPLALPLSSFCRSHTELAFLSQPLQHHPPTTHHHPRVLAS